MTDKQILAQSLRRYGSDFISHAASRGIEDIEAAGELMLEAARVLAEQPAEQEPVAWRWLYNGSQDSEKCFPMPGPDADVIAKAGASEFPRTVQYLYTAPQPAKQPLIADEICDSWEFTTGHQIQFGPSSEGRPMYLSTDEVIEFARAIERAHGIGEHE